MDARLQSGRDELVVRVQQALALATKKEANLLVDAVISSLEATLLNNLNSNGFALKLNSLGKFSVRHRPEILRKIPFTGETKMIDPKRKIRFIALGKLRQLERWRHSDVEIQPTYRNARKMSEVG